MKFLILISIVISVSQCLDLKRVLGRSFGTDGANVGSLVISNNTINFFGSGCSDESNETRSMYVTSGVLSYAHRIPVPSTTLNCLSYNIKANNQSHIALFSNGELKKNPWIEIVVGGLPSGLGNIVRRNGSDIGPTYNQLGNSLNPSEFRGYWVSWQNGNYKMGVIGRPAFLSWTDPNPFKITHVGVDTCCGTVGEVIIDETPNCPGL